MQPMIARGLAVLAILVANSAIGSAEAQSIADLAAYTGADRTEKLIAGAKKEGAVTVYASAPVPDMKPILNAFQKKYGIPAKHWRAGPEEIAQRTTNESKANRIEVDVIETNGPTMEAMRREKLFHTVASPVHGDLMPGAFVAGREWTGDRLNIIVGAFKTRAFDPATAPKSYADFTNPRFRGKLAVEADDHDWLATIARVKGEQATIDVFTRIAKANGIAARNGHTLLANLVAAGEVPYALTVFGYRIDQLKAQGAPVELNPIEPVVARMNGVAVARQPAHPHAALLLYDFMLTDAQQIFFERDFWPTNIKVKPLPKGMSLAFVDSGQMVDEGDKWRAIFKTILATKPE